MLNEHAMCWGCGTVYDTELLQRSFDYTERKSVYRCPNVTCGTILVPCDDLMMPTVYILNRKGYKTYWSCSGHYGERVNSTYITFSVPHDTVLERTIQEIIQSDYHGIKFDCKLDVREYNEDDEDYFFTPYKDGYTFKPDSDDAEVTSRIDAAADDIMNGVNICIRVSVHEDDETPKTFSFKPIYKDFLVDVNNALYQIAQALPKEFEISVE